MNEEAAQTLRERLTLKQRELDLIIGQAANLGRRICRVAQAGQVLVSQATYDLVREQVEATPITGLQLKGLDQDVTAYHVTRILREA